jgi:hypothetical protein
VPVTGKTKAPALSYYFNTIQNKPVDSSSPLQARRVPQGFHDHPEETELRHP